MNEASEPAILKAKLLHLSEFLHSLILGQEHVIPAIVSLFRRGLLRPLGGKRPRGTALLIGPTGVGKTETVLSAAEFLFGPEALLRIDMSDLQTQDRLGLLVGESRQDVGLLGDLYARTRQGVILFDEIEKAHPRVINLLLQILEPGHIRVSTGEVLDLSGFFIFATSNIATSEIIDLLHSSSTTLERHVLARVQQTLSPELFARFREKLVFHPLEFDCICQIGKPMLVKEIEVWGQCGCHLSANEEVLRFLVQHGFDRRFGARPLRDTIEKLVGDAVLADLDFGGSGCGRLCPERSKDRLVLRRGQA